MYKLKNFHIKMTKDSEWMIIPGHSLTHVMTVLGYYYAYQPYSYFVSEF